MAHTSAQERELLAATRRSEEEGAAHREEIARRMLELRASTAETMDIVALLRSEASQRAVIAEEAGRLRARLTERRALTAHTELVQLQRNARAAAATQAAQLEALRATRAEQQAELRALVTELDSLRSQVSAAVAAKSQAEGTMASLDSELLAQTSQLERERAIAARMELSRSH